MNVTAAARKFEHRGELRRGHRAQAVGRDADVRLQGALAARLASSSRAKPSRVADEALSTAGAAPPKPLCA
jgi:hypothetical protein